MQLKVECHVLMLLATSQTKHTKLSMWWWQPVLWQLMSYTLNPKS
jgi:hypothetical protein